jgi:CheY-like chemotaxis protein
MDSLAFATKATTMTTAISPGVYMETRRKEILCLCYDRSMLQVRQMLLEHFGYVVVPTTSLDNARDLVKNRCPDMLLMDNNDSGADFEQLATHVKRICPEVITVMLSPYFYSGNGGAIDRVVSKDDGPDVLLSQIHELLSDDDGKVSKQVSGLV